MYELKQVDKKFPGVHALKAVDFHVNRGEIVGLVGENGAGKSTLMKVIYGAYQPDGGQIVIDGKAVRFANPRAAMEQGIGMVFQEQSLIANLTVMENIFLGYEPQFVRLGVINWKAMATAARAQLAKVKLEIDPAMVTSDLSFAQRQLVELAKVLTLEERVAGQSGDPPGRADLGSGRGGGQAAVQAGAGTDITRRRSSLSRTDGRGDGAVRPHLCDEGRGGCRRGGAGPEVG